MALKATDEQIVSSYRELKTCRAVAKKLGMCTQSVHERLVKIGEPRNSLRPISQKERDAIRELYETGFNRGSGMVAALAKKLNRSLAIIYTYAHEMGVCDVHRKLTTARARSLVAGSVKHTKAQQANGTYRNAMQGKVFSKSQLEAKSQSSKEIWRSRSEQQRYELSQKRLRTRLQKYGRVGNAQRKGVTTWKAQWVEIGGSSIFFRSSWEVNYAHYLEWKKRRSEIQGWEYEPKTFWFEGVTSGPSSYLPDFKIISVDGSEEFHEVKGWMDERSCLTLERMRSHYPAIPIFVIGVKEYRTMNRHYANIVPGWIKSK